MLPKSSETVKVAVRCRPLNEDEINDRRQSIITTDTTRREIIVKNPKADSNESHKTFTFDQVYGIDSTQEQIYQDSAYSIVESVLEGYNGTIFAYGQTGSGKTYTMEGNLKKPQDRGIIPRAFDHIFEGLQATSGKQYLISCSFLEIYNEEIRDLLSANISNKLQLGEKKSGGFYVKNLTNFQVKDVQTMLQKFSEGAFSRATGATAMNPGSSRSHSMFTVTVERGEVSPDGKSHIVVGKLNLVDLAGSERCSKTGATDVRFKEGVNINQSLVTLGNVISALTDPSASYIPYRYSKLTRLLQDSLGGNTKTIMIANVGPADWNIEETLQTLRYANRAKNIKNKPKINEDPKDTMLKEYNNEIMKLRAQLMAIQSGKPINIGSLQLGENVEFVEKIVIVDDSEKINELQEKISREKEAIRQRAEEERLKIERQKNLAIERREQLLAALKEKEEAEQRSRKAQENLLLRLKNMEEKLIIGDKVTEKAHRQEKQLLKARMQLEEKKQEEMRLAEALIEKEDQKLLMENKFKTVNEELVDKKNKIQKVYSKYQEIKAQIQEQADEFAREKEEFMDQIWRLQQELKLRELMIETFVPAEESAKIDERARWDDESDEWVLLPPAERLRRPESAIGLKRPIAESSLVAAALGEANPRHKYENVLQLNLDMPTKNTEQYRRSSTNQRARTKVNAVLREQENEMSIMQDENQPNIALEFSYVEGKSF